MRITSLLGGDRGQQEPLIMMGGRMPQESPVDERVALRSMAIQGRRPQAEFRKSLNAPNPEK
jgi:hypothetical protein